MVTAFVARACAAGRTDSRIRAPAVPWRAMSQAAEIERVLGHQVFLDLHVKVLKEWQRDPKALQRLGF